MTIVDSDIVWRALASAHRRRILDLLRDGPQTTGHLHREMPGLSRFAVMQHLGVLGAAKLVLFRREGRRRLNFANPIPLREIYERWVSPPASSAAETDLHLKRYAEQEVVRNMENTEFRLVKIETELRINAPREKVFAAFFEDYDKWWPHRYHPDSTCSVEAKPGGFIVEHFASGGGAVTGTVMYIERPSIFIGTTPSALARGISAFNSHKLEEDGQATILKRTMELWGHVPQDVEEMFLSGTKQLMDTSLLEFLEQGVEYAAGGPS